MSFIRHLEKKDALEYPAHIQLYLNFDQVSNKADVEFVTSVASSTFLKFFQAQEIFSRFLAKKTFSVCFTEFGLEFSQNE